MASIMYRIGQKLEGRLGSYVITKVVQNTVWFAKLDITFARTPIIVCHLTSA
jgi:hypothetical protein